MGVYDNRCGLCGPVQRRSGISVRSTNAATMAPAAATRTFVVMLAASSVGAAGCWPTFSEKEGRNEEGISGALGCGASSLLGGTSSACGVNGP